MNECSPLLKDPQKDSKWIRTATLARLVTFASSFSEGWEIALFALVIMPITKEFGLSSTQVALLASLPLVAAAFGYLFMSWIMDAVGRKPAIIATYVMQFAGCLVMCTAPDLLILGIGRAILSIGIKSGVTCVSVYMTELSPAADRGALVSIEELYINLGILAATFAAWLMMGVEMISWRVFVAAGAVAPTLSLACILPPQVPESPRYLHHKGHSEQAREVLRSALDGDEVEISKTLNLWSQEWKDAEAREQQTWQESAQEFRSLLKHKGFQIASACWLARAGSGIAIMGTYGALFLTGKGEETTLRWFVFAQVGKFLALFPIVLWLINKFGRRTLFLTSAVGCGLCMAGAAICKWHDAHFFIFASCIVMYFMSFSIGYGPVVWVYCFEILPAELRGRSAAVSILIGDTLNLTLIFLGPLLWEFHHALPFLVLAVTNLFAFGFFWAACPETKGMILEEAKEFLHAADTGRNDA